MSNHHGTGRIPGRFRQGDPADRTLLTEITITPPAEPAICAPIESESRALKAARARRLTDPLGAKGFRQSRRRIEREQRARGRTFAASVVTFASCFGLLVYTNHSERVDRDLSSVASSISSQVETQSASNVSSDIERITFTLGASDTITVLPTATSLPKPRQTPKPRPTSNPRDNGSMSPSHPQKPPPPAVTRTKSS